MWCGTVAHENSHELQYHTTCHHQCSTMCLVFRTHHLHEITLAVIWSCYWCCKLRIKQSRRCCMINTVNQESHLFVNEWWSITFCRVPSGNLQLKLTLTKFWMTPQIKLRMTSSNQIYQHLYRQISYPTTTLQCLILHIHPRLVQHLTTINFDCWMIVGLMCVSLNTLVNSTEMAER